jgi:glycosyltransferase involved in cell wall biosynthesis
VVAGNDEEYYHAKLALLARQCGVSDRLEFVGRVEGCSKWDLFRHAALFVLPSYSENFGIAVLEAMAAGCPVVVTPEVGLASDVAAAAAGVVVDGEPRRLAEAINGLLADANARARMGDAGRRIAKERFSWDAIAAQMDQVYLDCMSQPREARLTQRYA